MKPVLTIVKFGGKIIDQPLELEKALKAFSSLPNPKILVHGGGTMASSMMEKMGLEAVMIEGRRVTDEATLDVVVMVYAGLINKKIVASLQALNNNALGLSGADMNLIQAHKRIVKDIDYGFAGDVDSINTNALEKLLLDGVVPVFCPITHNNEGQLLNTNADTIAAVIAAAMANSHEVHLVYTFEKKGVMKNLETEEVFEEINTILYSQYVDTGILSGGILPKLDNAFDSVKKGVEKVVICHHEALAKWGHEEFDGTTIVK
ncbi:MAG: acetylglutamate kinase [Cyclobacteriaceae bacterium]|nr:acetylglutamate kinase [Cyclobacteriaceae bacterium]